MNLEGKLFQLTMEHLLNLTDIHHKLNQSLFGQGGEGHADRCVLANIAIEEMICDIVDVLKQNKGQVA